MEIIIGMIMGVVIGSLITLIADYFIQRKKFRDNDDVYRHSFESLNKQQKKCQCSGQKNQAKGKNAVSTSKNKGNK